MSEKEYLGDGAYISNDGFSIAVECDRENGTNIVYLEPQMLLEAVKYGVRKGVISLDWFLKEMGRKFK